jgi:transposase
VAGCGQEQDRRQRRWALALAEGAGYWKAVVAIAAKNQRIAWAVLHLGEHFKAPA